MRYSPTKGLTSCPPTPVKTAISGARLTKHPSKSFPSITEENVTVEENDTKVEFPGVPRTLKRHASCSSITEEDVTDEEGPTVIEYVRYESEESSSDEYELLDEDDPVFFNDQAPNRWEYQ